jgi:protoporphyrinogen oxidase
VRCVLSYLWVRVFPPADRTTLEGYITANYGRRLYEHFFKTYNEKVWGVPASELSADWGAQRIKGMSLSQAVLEPLRSRLLGAPRDRARQVTSLIEEFEYPKLGPGMMWEHCQKKVLDGGGDVRLSSEVVAIRRRAGGGRRVVYRAGGRDRIVDAGHVISSMPLSALAGAMDPPPPAEVLDAADGLGYRDFLTVALVVPASRAFPDNWIYVHHPGVRVGRIQNFGAWSPHMVKDGRTCLGLEYFVFEGDTTWEMADDDLVAMATAELASMGLASAADVERGFVVRMPKAYPVYDEGYRASVDVIRRWLDTAAPDVHPVGRNGMHKYNNQDHSMFTAMLTVENIVDGAGHDIWAVNVDEEYHEEGDHATSGVAAGVCGRTPVPASGGGTGRDAPVLPTRAVGAR